MKNIKNILLVSLLGASCNLHAATVPDVTVPDAAAIQKLDKERLERYLEEEKLKKLAPEKPVISLPKQGKAQSGASDTKNIKVNRFEVTASEILNSAEIKAILTPYEGKRVSLKDLFDAVNAVNTLYEAKGAKTARAILPPQDIKDGIVKIRLIEARVGEVKVLGTNSLNKSFVSDRIKQKPGSLVSVARLEADLIRYNALYESKLSASIAAGAKVGTTDISIAVEEPKPFQFVTFADNAGRESVGLGRIGAIFTGKNIAGENDNLQVVVTGSEGSKSLGVTYSIPITEDDMRLETSFNAGAIEIIEGPFVPLNITGSSRDVTVGIAQPFSVNINRQWAAYGRLSARNSVSEFDGYVQQDSDLKVISVGVRGEAHYDDYAWSVDNNLNFGTKELGGEEAFTYYRANASFMEQVSPKTTMLARAGLQYSASEIVPSGEQFQIGGLNTVRGFSEGLLSGRNGYFTSLEMRHVLINSAPTKETNNLAHVVQGLVFFDHGGAFPYIPGQSITKDDFLTSMGVGLIIDVGSRFNARVSVGYPMEDNPAEANQSTPMIHAGINISWL